MEDEFKEEDDNDELLERLKNNSKTYASFLDKYRCIIGLDKYSFNIGFAINVDDELNDFLEIDLDTFSFNLILSSEFESYTDSEKIMFLSNILVDARLLVYEERKKRLVELEEDDLRRDLNNLIFKTTALFMDNKKK